jgi:ThiF family
MSLPAFYPRIAEALGPVVGASTDLSEYLKDITVSLRAEDGVEADSVHRAGFVFVTNLCARLYPRLRIIAEKSLTDECAALALRINARCDISTESASSDAALIWGGRCNGEAGVTVGANGWRLLVDQYDVANVGRTNIITSLAVAAFGVGEVFRTVFARFLKCGRVAPTPGVLNLLTLDGSNAVLPDLPDNIPLGRVHLAGAGAVGQAALYTLAQTTASGALVVVDPESIALSNLQRYVLAFDSDVGIQKTQIARRAIEESALSFVGVDAVWGDQDATVSKIETVCTALDSSAARIGVQAGLPRRIFNAWTQPADIGWSRHESFGDDACLACLYFPSGPRPSQHELVARAVRQAELRVLAYLSCRIPIDVPLQYGQIPRLANYVVPPEASTWLERSILEDMVRDLGIDDTSARSWTGKQLSDFYREGICGGAVLSDRRGELTGDVVVPLAHQSAFAGIMLAAQLLIACVPELRHVRSPFFEARLDMLTGLPQMVARPRHRTPRCLCSDGDFLRRYLEKWSQ